MNVALPEIDGRILTRAISFKAAGLRDDATEFGAVLHRPLADRVAFVADLAAAWARLRRKAPAEKRLACVLPDYPARGGRTGYAVGLDTPASAVSICEILLAAGYDVTGCDGPSLIAALAEGPREAVLTLAEYEAELALAPEPFRAAVSAAWGEAAEDALLIDGAFRFRFVRLGKLIVAVQPDRGEPQARKGRLSRPDARAAPRLRRLPLLAHPQGAGRRADPARRPWHARVAAGQGGRAVGFLRAGSSPRRRRR